MVSSILQPLSFLTSFYSLKNGLSHTEDAGVTQTEVGGVTHTAFVVQEAPFLWLLLELDFKADCEHSARIVEGIFAR